MPAQPAAQQPKTAPATVQQAKQLPKLSDQLAVLQPEVAKVLPAHVTPEKFMRVVQTAIASKPELARADIKSLLTSAIKCAQDGLVPDGREAVFAIYRTKVKERGKPDRWIDKVQYMPMTYGILKKVRQSGELKSLTINVVLDADNFRYWVDDAGEHITHEPNLDAPDRGKVRASYSIAETKDGGKYYEVMTLGQIHAVRAMSKSKDDGPWVTWFDEMARKSVFRRLSKRLPMSTDIERTVRRDDELYDLHASRTLSAPSGTDAARSLLGLNDVLQESDLDGEIVQQHTGPKFTDESAAELVASATTAEELKDSWVTIANDYFETGRELPQTLQDAYAVKLDSLRAPKQ